MAATRTRLPVVLVFGLLLGLLLFVTPTVACGRSRPQPEGDRQDVTAPPTAVAAPAAAFAPAATIRELMDVLIDPSADSIWESVQIEATPAGTTRKAPASAEEWTAIRRHALTIAEASSLLVAPGRAVASGGAAAPAAGSMDLPPAAIAQLIASDPRGWAGRAQGLREAAMSVLRAADARDADGLLVAGETLDAACEACHSTFWYPAPPPAPGTRRP